MLIWLNGNIGSGKSTVAQAIRHLSGWPVFALDSYRHRDNPEATVAGDRQALANMMIDLGQYKQHAIMEMTSFNQRAEEVLEAYPGATWMVLLKCPARVCLDRHRNRILAGYRLPPWPYRTEITTSIQRMDESLRTLEHHAEYDVLDGEEQPVCAYCLARQILADIPDQWRQL